MEPRWVVQLSKMEDCQWYSESGLDKCMGQLQEGCGTGWALNPTIALSLEPPLTMLQISIIREIEARKVFLQGCDLQGRCAVISFLQMASVCNMSHALPRLWLSMPFLPIQSVLTCYLCRPVVLVLAARHVIEGRNLEETRKLICYTLETAVAAADVKHNPVGQILCIFDLSGSLLALPEHESAPHLLLPQGHPHQRLHHPNRSHLRILSQSLQRRPIACRLEARVSDW